MSPPQAKCPVCHSTVMTFVDHGRATYPHHGPKIIDGDSCEASAWIVEDDEVIPATRSRRLGRPRTSLDDFDELAARRNRKDRT